MQITLIDLLKKTLEQGGSDLFLIPGAPPTAKVNGQMMKIDDGRLLPPDVDALIDETYVLANGRTKDALSEMGDDDFSFSLQRMCRFRCNVYRQRGTNAATYRVVALGLPDPQALHIPPLVMDLANYRSGLVLVTGSAGSGKSTSLACLVDRINSTRSGHIITIEDPIEYLHSHRMSLVSQREISGDCPTFARALRAALRQAPDVIMLGEMRDSETMSVAITAAETGHLVMSSLHTIGAAKTIDRILDSFPAEQQQQVRVQLSMVLRAVVSQRLIPCKNGELMPVFEVMTVNSAVQNLIRDGKTHQIDNVIYGGTADRTMMSMDNELLRLYRAGLITAESAQIYAVNQEIMKKRLI